MKYPYSFLKDNGNAKDYDKQVELFNNWVISNDIKKQVTRCSSWTDLIPGSKKLMKADKKKFGYYPKTEYQHPPGYDHPLMFEDNEYDRVYVLQPYGCDKEALTEWAGVRGIDFFIYPKTMSWYYYNNTLLIELRIGNHAMFISFLTERSKL